MVLNFTIGQKIKALRVEADLTQEELANRARLTKGFISQLENEKFQTSISLESLSDIVDALGITLAEFFSETDRKPVVFTKRDRIPVEYEGSEKFELLIPGSTNNIMDPILLEIKPGEKLPPNDPHQGEQFGFVLKGILTLVLNKTRYEVRKNNCFYFSSNETYQFLNKSKQTVSLLWVTTPPQM